MDNEKIKNNIGIHGYDGHIYCTDRLRSLTGIVIGVYQGNNVLVEAPGDMPKMTRLIVDEKSLYIYRADYNIFDTGLFKAN